ncbi:MAG: NfeD family protein [FCB group bacterium]|jgi:membrane-bound serine protease (ClpP class)|nr:NfeD family protein [FCB group bacterium]
MIRRLTWLLVFVAVLWPVIAAGAPAAAGSKVVICPLEGMIDDGLLVLVKRAMVEAKDADAIVFVIDTFGGRVDSAVNIGDVILGAPCKTIAYVTGKGAISAGAMIAFACNEIEMKPGTTIGAAQPVMMSPSGTEPTGEKELSYVRKRMRALAEVNGHNADIAEAMVDKAVVLAKREVNGKTEVFSIGRGGGGSGGEVPAVQENPLERILGAPPRVQPIVAPAPAIPDPEPPEGAQVIDSGSQLLTLTPNEALEYGLIQSTAKSLDEVLEQHDLADAQRVQLTLTWAEHTFRFLTSPLVSMLLLALGVGGIYYEAKAPGFGLPGIVGITCLTLFFGAQYIIGLAEWLDILLVVVGIGLILAEIFIIPGFGLPGVAGIICFLLGIYLSLTNVAVPQYPWDFDRLRNAGISLGGAAAILTLMIAALWRLLPQTPIYRGVVLQDMQGSDEGYTVQTVSDELEAVGLQGTALTVLRPAGRGRFGGRTYNVVSRAEYIEEGTPIVIVEVEGNRYVVDKT